MLLAVMVAQAHYSPGAAFDQWGTSHYLLYPGETAVHIAGELVAVGLLPASTQCKKLLLDPGGGSGYPPFCKVQ